MEKQISRGLKTTFLVHFILAVIYGLVLLIFPQAWGRSAGIAIDPTDPYRLVGAALLTLAVGSWPAYRETEWEKVKILIQMEIFWTILAALVILWGIIFFGLARLEWMNFAFLTAFAIAFSFFYAGIEAV
jgi:uncharacterized protein YjeT (DUF2065 family)